MTADRAPKHLPAIGSVRRLQRWHFSGRRREVHVNGRQPFRVAHAVHVIGPHRGAEVVRLQPAQIRVVVQPPNENVVLGAQVGVERPFLSGGHEHHVVLADETAGEHGTQAEIDQAAVERRRRVEPPRFPRDVVLGARFGDERDLLVGSSSDTSAILDVNGLAPARPEDPRGIVEHELHAHFQSGMRKSSITQLPSRRVQTS